MTERSTGRRVTLVVPVYNEQESLNELHQRITTTATGAGWQWDVVYVDDGSRDGSLDTLKAIQAAADNVTVAVQRRNHGKSIALMTGFTLATGDFVCTLDSDLQDEPDELPRLLAKIDEGYDIVTGWKRDRKDPLSKRIPSKIANGMTGLTTGIRLNDMNSGIKAYRADCAKDLRIYGDLHRYIPIIAHLNGYNVTEIPVVHHERKYGQSKYGAGRLIRGGLDLLTVLFLSRFSLRPFHLFGTAGGVLLLIGFLINLKLAIDWFGGVRGLSDRPILLLGILLMLVGIQLLTTGLVGELIVSFMQQRSDPLAMTRTIYRPDDKNGARS